MSSRNENIPESHPQRTLRQYESVSLSRSNIKLFSGQSILTMKETCLKLFMFFLRPDPATLILFPARQETPTFLLQGKVVEVCNIERTPYKFIRKV
jgi:hypothetical protein